MKILEKMISVVLIIALAISFMACSKHKAPIASEATIEIGQTESQTPKEIGRDLFSFQVKYGGSYYKLPIPIPELIKNGWVLQSNGDEIIAARSSLVGVELRKDNQVLNTQIMNYSDKSVPAKYCFVTYIEYYNLGANVSLELPKGITENSTMEEITAAYGKPDRVEKSSTFNYYTYGDIFKQVVFMTKNGKIEKIEVQYSPKNLD